MDGTVPVAADLNSNWTAINTEIRPVGTGGTGISTFVTGDLIYASASNTLSARAAGTTGQSLTMVAGVPAWAWVGGISLAGTLQGSANGTDYTSAASTTWADVDATNLKASVTVTTGAKFLMVAVHAAVGAAACTDSAAHMQVLAAGSTTAVGAYIQNGALSPGGRYTMFGVIANPTPGAQTIALQYRGDGTNTVVVKNQVIESATQCQARMMYLITT